MQGSIKLQYAADDDIWIYVVKTFTLKELLKFHFTVLRYVRSYCISNYSMFWQGQLLKYTSITISKSRALLNQIFKKYKLALMQRSSSHNRCSYIAHALHTSPATLRSGLRHRYRRGRSRVRFPGRSNLTPLPTDRHCCDVSSELCSPGDFTRRYVAEMDPTTRYTLPRNTASMMEIWFIHPLLHNYQIYTDCLRHREMQARHGPGVH